MNIQGRVVWITGASSGIGRASAIAFAKQHANLILSARREEKLEETAKKCREQGVKAKVLSFDISDKEKHTEVVEKALSLFGRIDVFFHNAGVSQRSKIIETSLDTDYKLMEINYFSGVSLTKKLLPAMIKNGGGHIAVTSSIVGFFGFPLRSAYSASKHALHGFYETLRAELNKEKINVTIVIPGRIKTGISLNALDKEGNPHGKMDPGQHQGISPEKCAKIIIKAVKKNKKEVLIGGKELFMVYIKKYIPVLFHYIVRRIEHK